MIKLIHYSVSNVKNESKTSWHSSEITTAKGIRKFLSHPDKVKNMQLF